MKQEIKKSLQEAFQTKNLNLFLGAGVSVGNKLPSWEKLVLSMYFLTISEQELGGWRPYSNYLYAIAEWFLKYNEEPLEITARKLQKYHENDDGKFIERLHKILYGNHIDEYGNPRGSISKNTLRNQNTTLNAVAKLCESLKKGVKSVITYNYDNLLEIAIENTDHHSIFQAKSSAHQKGIPIYHVHGYIPFESSSPHSKKEEIVFTEDQYNQVSNNAYHWSNIIQLQAISGSINLMIGLSLSDRNIRRLFDAASNTPIHSTTYAILKEPDTSTPEIEVLDDIHKKAIRYLKDFQNSGIKSGASESVFFNNPGIKSESPNFKNSFKGVKGKRYQYEIAGIIGEVKKQAKEQQEYVLNTLGITPIWIKDFGEIPEIVDQIL